MHYRMFNSISRPGHPGVKLSAGISEYSRGGGRGGHNHLSLRNTALKREVTSVALTFSSVKWGVFS